VNILFHIPTLSQQAGGSRQYAIAMLDTLAEDRSGNQYYIFHNLSDKLVLDIIAGNEHIHLIPSNISTEKKAQKFLRNLIHCINYSLNKFKSSFQLNEYSYLTTICKKYKIDILHSPTQHIPLAKNVKKICTMHDVQELHYPEYFTPQERADRAIVFLSSLTNANKVVVSYEHIKADLIKYFQLPEEKVLVCLLNMKNLWFKKYIDSPLKDISMLNLPDKFLLYPANTWEHKNHIRLLEAIAYLRDNNNIYINLVCTGSKTDFFSKNIAGKLTELKLENLVTFPGIVDEEILYSIYNKCTALVIPTIYEAGSFPLMESMLMGIPVICSNVTSLPETIGDSRFIFDPFKVEDIADKCSKIYNDENYREENKTNSNKHSEKILNTGALNKILNMYVSL
jgi:glycosyltransferase involved in cell wall biosynthesis